jgi:HPt (histidine-containing phosphotransfer) domain-containing protein
MSNIRNAITSGDLEALGFAIHTLKGVIGNFSAQPASEAAERLEILADSGDRTGLNVALATLEVEIAGLLEALKLYHDGQMVCVS